MYPGAGGPRAASLSGPPPAAACPAGGPRAAPSHGSRSRGRARSLAGAGEMRPYPSQTGRRRRTVSCMTRAARCMSGRAPRRSGALTPLRPRSPIQPQFRARLPRKPPSLRQTSGTPPFVPGDAVYPRASIVLMGWRVTHIRGGVRLAAGRGERPPDRAYSAACRQARRITCRRMAGARTLAARLIVVTADCAVGAQSHRLAAHPAADLVSHRHFSLKLLGCPCYGRG